MKRKYYALLALGASLLTGLNCIPNVGTSFTNLFNLFQQTT